MTSLPTHPRAWPVRRSALELVPGHAAGVLALGAVLVCLVVLLGVGLTGNGTDGGGAVVFSAAYVALLGLAALSCASRAVARPHERAAWGAFAAGFALWFGGELAYLASGSVPSVLENVAFFGFYAGAAAGLALLARVSGDPRRELIDAGIVFAGLASLWAWLCWGQGPGDLSGGLVFDLGYALADLTLAAAAIGLMQAMGWRLSLRWLLIAGGFVIVALVDSIYLVESARGTYVDGTALDVLWPLGALAVAAAAWLPAAARGPARESFSLAVAAASVLTATAILAVDHFVRAGSAAVALATVTVFLGVVRGAVIHAQRVAAEDSLIVEATRTVHALATAVDAKDPYTRYHSDHVSVYAMAIAERLELPAGCVERISVAGRLHDVGKIAVPDAILLKEGALSPAEWEVMKRHASEGERIVRSVGLDEIACWIRHHHERWDGNGYPDGLVRDAAPLESRILTVADSLDAMTTSRSYRGKLTADEARVELAASAGHQFDPVVAAAALDLIDEGVLPIAAAPPVRAAAVLTAGPA